MTERVYYHDPGLLEFTAVVTSVRHDEKGHETVLDRSAFYPTSGGQSFDTGTLNGVQVTDVTEDEQGEVIHHTAEPVGAPGQSVTGLVDKIRRRRHRQSHTAQHILSAGFHHLFGHVTASVHLGEEYSAIEFDVPSLSDEDVRRAEEWANDKIADNLPIEILFVPADRVAALPMRKPSQRAGELRIIKIGEIDYVACGGTHCYSTGGVGLIKIVATEKMRGRALIKYLCGDLARDDYRLRYNVTDSLARNLTCNVTDLDDKVGRMAGEYKDIRRDLSLARKELLPGLAERLAAESEEVGQVKVIVARPENFDLSHAASLATMAADRVGGLAVLLLDGRVVIGAAENSDLDAGKVARALADRTDLKGGGNRRQAQLGGAPVNDDELFHRLLREILGHA